MIHNSKALPHEQLEIFFDEFFRLIVNADPSQHGAFLTRAEQEFRRAGYRDENSAGVQNILVVRLDAIGDMIVTSGFLRELRKNFPRARITLLVSPFVLPIVELCPYVNEVLSFDFKLLNGTLPEWLKHIADFCREHLWQKMFSLAFSPRWGKGNLHALLMTWMSGARERIGYGTNPYESWLGEPSAEETAQDNFLLTKSVGTPRKVVSEAGKHFYLLEALGLPVKEKHMELFFGTQDFIRARELLQTIPPNCKKVLLGIGGSARMKKYPVEKYLVALKELAKKNLVFVIVGGQSELDDADFLEMNLPHGKVLNLVGKTTLRETQAIAVQTDFYVGNDTSAVHMAATAKIPCLVLYREAEDRENYSPAVFSEFQCFPPWQTNSIILRPAHPLDDCAEMPPLCGVCRHIEEPHCITQITPQEIIGGFEALEKL